MSHTFLRQACSGLDAETGATECKRMAPLPALAAKHHSPNWLQRAPQLRNAKHALITNSRSCASLYSARKRNYNKAYVVVVLLTLRNYDNLTYMHT